ncbi:Hsp20/alpha crystallin family protein [Natronobiforma cellulositropha]|uniref:Hsp20/alpha crystallin family protein n=1 Tax=Natronobiforma cellulositropha TaxID=1679076 RepID=UPI0021D5D788|nr:Hsp20/alpha crystallin family protein [Natronobiforma cellulositropha]
MSSTRVGDRLEGPMHVEHDREAGYTEVALDAASHAVSEVTVAVGSTRIRLALESGDGERLVAPPPGYSFDGERRAYWHNGVVTVRVGLSPADGWV